MVKYLLAIDGSANAILASEELLKIVDTDKDEVILIEVVRKELELMEFIMGYWGEALPEF